MKKFKKISSSFGTFLNTNSYIEITNDNDFGYIDKSIECFHILGECTNTIINSESKKTFIKYINNELNILKKTQDYTFIKVGASVNWHKFVLECEKLNLYGLENLAFIPGSVGAAPIQNIGAYGVEVSEFISEITCYDIEHQKNLVLKKNQCKFAYRQSVFQRKKFIIKDITFRLKNYFNPNLSYSSLRNYIDKKFNKSINPINLIKIIGIIRSNRLPNLKKIPNCGSFFKHPIIKKDNKFKKYLVCFENSKMKISATKLIETIENEINFYGGLKFYDTNKLVLTNTENCSFKDLISTIESINTLISNKFDICLDVEPEIIT